MVSGGRLVVGGASQFVNILPFFRPQAFTSPHSQKHSLYFTGAFFRRYPNTHNWNVLYFPLIWLYSTDFWNHCRTFRDTHYFCMNIALDGHTAIRGLFFPTLRSRLSIPRGQKKFNSNHNCSRIGWSNWINFPAHSNHTQTQRGPVQGLLIPRMVLFFPHHSISKLIIVGLVARNSLQSIATSFPLMKFNPFKIHPSIDRRRCQISGARKTNDLSIILP